jgi:predicted metal-dependent phosphoesterase TrpH
VIRRIVLAAAIAAAGLHLVPALAVDGAAPTVSTHGYRSLIGGMHGHSDYSDGYPGSTPETVFASAKGLGNDFFAISDHSDTLGLPLVANEECIDPALTASGQGLVTCPGGDPDPTKTVRKWDATADYAAAATTPAFSALRGFEWTSDRFGHMNVYFSRNYANAKGDGGYATMQAFWQWFLRRPELGGGGDGLGTFNHPGDKKLQGVGGQDPQVNWDDFAYEPAADDRMVGIELYNTRAEYGDYYVHALDKGWHLGAVGAEDLGHQRGDDWGGPGWAKTVVLAERNDAASIRSAMLARRFYAVERPGTRLDFTVDGALMGSRLARPAGSPLHLHAAVNDAGVPLEVVTSGGAVVAAGTGTLDAVVPAPAHGWFFVRARGGSNGGSLAYSSPVWVTPGPQPPIGEWLAGDLHVHTCYSHDAWCPPEDDNTGPQPGQDPADAVDALVNDSYTLSGSVDERFTEASVKGLDYLAITDHNDVRSQSAPGFGGHGVVGIPAYENSLHGHAQMLGATHILDKGDSSAAAVNQMADALRAEGGVFQTNHPADHTKAPFFSGCDDTSGLGWGYGFDVQPDTIEVWNIGHFLQPPSPAGNSNDDAERYWECWLDRGARIAATGGSDSHWISTTAVQGPGNPTTWVFARERSAAGVLQALREGRTSVSLLPPTMGSARLALEADVDGDGIFEAIIGDTVPPGAALRVRATGLLGQGLVTVRANGHTVLENAPLGPGGEVRLNAPGAPGWVRASLLLPDAKAERTAACDPVIGTVSTYCRNHLVEVALTSPIYLARPAVATAIALTGSAHGSTVTGRAVLTAADGTPLAGRTITFAVGGATTTAVTDAAGTALATLTVDDHGRTQTLTASFLGDPPYEPSSATTTVTWGH